MFLKSVWVERRVLSLLSSPFCLSLQHAFQDARHLFLVMPFMSGGDLRYHLREHGKLTEKHTIIYAAEILLGIARMHQAPLHLQQLVVIVCECACV